jgi:hypothetical protein
MTTLYKILTGVVSVLAIGLCVIAYYMQLQGVLGLVVSFAVLMAITAAGAMWAALGLRDDNPRSDKSVRR